MKTLVSVVLFLSCGVLFAAEAVPKLPVQVEYISPERFTDISSTNHGPPNPNYLDQLRKHVEKKAAGYLRPGEQLTISIKDIDMAGGFEPWIMPINPDVRMVRDIYPPRIVLNYELRDGDGKVLQAGDEKLSNPAFLLNPRPNSLDNMRHEKALLDGWLSKVFSGRAGN